MRVYDALLSHKQPVHPTINAAPGLFLSELPMTTTRRPYGPEEKRKTRRTPTAGRCGWRFLGTERL